MEVNQGLLQEEQKQTEILTHQANILDKPRKSTTLDSIQKSPTEAAIIGFPKLPQEIREMIWLACIPQSRIIECAWIEVTGTDDDDDDLSTEPDLVLSSKLPPPMVLQICRESRHAALKKLHASFGSPGTTTRRFRFDPEMDTICLMSTDKDTFYWEEITVPWSDASLETVKNLAVDSRVLVQWWSVRDDVTAPEYLFLCNFHQLQSLTIVVHASDWRRLPDCVQGFETKSRSPPQFVGTVNTRLIRRYEWLVKETLRWEASCMYEEQGGHQHNPEILDSLLNDIFPDLQIMVKLELRNGKICCHGEGYQGTAGWP